MNELICDWCGRYTHDDKSTVFDMYYPDKVRQERRCFDCDPPEEDWS